MHRRALLLVTLLLVACQDDVVDNAVPEPADVERLEARLAQHPCIGPLADWERNYRYSRKTGLFSPHSLNPDIDVIEFHLRRAGTIAISPGRNVMAPAPSGDWPDSNPIQSVDGKFTLSSSSLNISPCTPAGRS